jgi:hypothetical protein
MISWCIIGILLSLATIIGGAQVQLQPQQLVIYPQARQAIHYPQPTLQDQPSIQASYSQVPQSQLQPQIQQPTYAQVLHAPHGAGFQGDGREAPARYLELEIKYPVDPGMPSQFFRVPLPSPPRKRTRREHDNYQPMTANDLRVLVQDVVRQEMPPPPCFPPVPPPSYSSPPPAYAMRPPTPIIMQEMPYYPSAPGSSQPQQNIIERPRGSQGDSYHRTNASEPRVIVLG